MAAGFDADLAVIDEGDSWTVRAAEMHNLNRYTPFEGRTLIGRVTATFVRGASVYSRSSEGVESFGPVGFGRHVKRRTRVSP
jgi:dihydroorotase-like cyclic amidohydrolase